MEIVGLQLPDGSLERHVESTRWAVPDEVWIERDRILWTMQWLLPQTRDAEREFNRYMEPRKGMLERFVNLREASESRIVDFACRFGPLGVITFGRGRHRRWAIPEAVGIYYQCDPDTKVFGGKEPLSHWRHWTQKMYSALIIAGELSGGRRPPDEHWSRLFPSTIAGQDDWQDPVVLEHARCQFFLELSWWQTFADIRLYIHGFRCRIEVNTPSLFSGLIWQLMNAATRSAGVFFCSACGDAYSPERKPASGTRHFCTKSECKRARTRAAVNDYRARRRELG